jgi:hypothetical protein
VQFSERLIEVFDGFGTVSAEIAIGIGLKIVPGVLDLLDGLANDGVALMFLGCWWLRSRRDKHRSGQYTRQEYSPKSL